MSTIELRNAYIVAKEVDTILEMIYEGKYNGIDELSTLFADAYLKKTNQLYTGLRMSIKNITRRLIMDKKPYELNITVTENGSTMQQITTRDDCKVNFYTKEGLLKIDFKKWHDNDI